MAGEKTFFFIIYPLKQKLHPGGKGKQYYFTPPSHSKRGSFSTLIKQHT